MKLLKQNRKGQIERWRNTDFPVVVRWIGRGEDAWQAECPILPGCISIATTRKRALERIRERIVRQVSRGQQCSKLYLMSVRPLLGRRLTEHEVKFCLAIRFCIGIEVDTQEIQLYHLCHSREDGGNALCESDKLWFHAGLLGGNGMFTKVTCSQCVQELELMMKSERAPGEGLTPVVGQP